MQTDVTEAGPFERMLTLRLDEAELEPAMNATARKLSREMKIKGFRPGKAPRVIVERMVGSTALRKEAIDDALSGFVTDALGETDLDPATLPRIEDIRDGESGGVEVDVRITLWPTVSSIPDFSNRTVEVQRPDVAEDELSDHIDRLRSQFAELEDVSRAADEGDYVMINLTAEAGSGEVPEAAANDLLYEVGSRSFIPGLDELLVGSSAGDIREGPGSLPEGFGEHSGGDVSLRVLVKGVRAKKLPEVTDEWVSDVTEFETVDELRETLRENLLAMKRGEANAEFRQKLVEDLVEELEVDLPDALVEAEMEASLHGLAHTLEGQGVDLETYLSVTGRGQEEFLADVRERASKALKTRILLEAVAEAEGIEVGDEDIDAAISEMAMQSRRDPQAVREAIEESGREHTLTGDILRRKALDLLLEEARPVDADSNPIDLSVPDDDDGAQEKQNATVPGEDTIEESGLDADNLDDDS